MAAAIGCPSDLWLTLLVSITDYTLVMFPKVEELKSSQTHAIILLLLHFVALNFSTRVKLQGKMVNVHLSIVNLALCLSDLPDQREQGCERDCYFTKAGPQPPFKFEVKA